MGQPPTVTVTREPPDPTEALRIALYEDDLRGAELAIDAGANLITMRSKTSEPSTPLIEAAKYSASILRFLLTHGSNPNQTDPQGFSPLHYARCIHSVELLLQAGADPNASSRRGVTPLHCCHDPDSCVRLLDAGANPWATTASGAYPWQSLRQDARRWGRASQHEAPARRCLEAADLVEASAEFSALLSRTPRASLPPTRQGRRL